MKRKNKITLSIIILILIILAGFKVYTGQKVTLMEIEESIKNIPLELEYMNLLLSGVDYNEYPTQQQILRKGKKAIAPFTHTKECLSKCKGVHEENYELLTEFKRLDKKINIKGETYSYPYIFSLHNRKEEKNYNLYYEMDIALLGEESEFKELQEIIDKLEDDWGIEISQTVRVKGNVEGEIEEVLKTQYAKQIFEKLDAYWTSDYKLKKQQEDLYYAFIKRFKDYEMDAKGNKYNVVIKFIFDPQTKQTQFMLEFPAEI